MTSEGRPPDAMTTDARDVVARYEQGLPEEGYSGQEGVRRFGELALRIRPSESAATFHGALRRISKEQRSEFLHDLERRAEAQGIPLPFSGTGYALDQDRDPQELAQILTGLHEQQPGLMTRLFQARGPERHETLSAGATAVLAGVVACGFKPTVGTSGETETPAP